MRQVLPYLRPSVSGAASPTRLRRIAVLALVFEGLAFGLLAVLVFYFPDHLTGDPPPSVLEQAVRLPCLVLLFPAAIAATGGWGDGAAFPLAVVGPLIWALVLDGVFAFVRAARVRAS